jgi:hypothetical protein
MLPPWNGLCVQVGVVWRWVWRCVWVGTGAWIEGTCTHSTHSHTENSAATRIPGDCCPSNPACCCWCSMMDHAVKAELQYMLGAHVALGPQKHRSGCQHQAPTSHSHPSWLRHHAPQPVQHAHATPPPPLQQLCPFPSPLHLTHPAVLSAPTMMGTSVMPSTLGPAAGHRQCSPTRSADNGGACEPTAPHA